MHESPPGHVALKPSPSWGVPCLYSWMKGTNIRARNSFIAKTNTRRKLAFVENHIVVS